MLQYPRDDMVVMVLFIEWGIDRILLVRLYLALCDKKQETSRMHDWRTLTALSASARLHLDELDSGTDSPKIQSISPDIHPSIHPPKFIIKNQAIKVTVHI